MYQYRITRLVKIINSDTLVVDLDLGFKLQTQVAIKLNGVEVPDLDLLSDDDPEVTLRKNIVSWFKWAPRPWIVQVTKTGSTWSGDVFDRDGNILANALDAPVPLPPSEAETQVIKFDGVPQAITPVQE